MSPEQQQLHAAIAALEAQRALLGDAVVDSMVAPARARLAGLAGSAISAAPEPAQVLRQVSILFLDVVGSTALSQQLDPEAISAVMDDALARGSHVVRSHGGKVLQYAGDSMLAVFGADETREDEAERAVHCGLALLELGRALGTEVRAAHGHMGFDVRVGIHTGSVLLGGGVDAEGNIRGLAVNIAARLEQAAPAGALRISHDTHTQVRGLFDVAVQPPVAVKGVAAPLQSYLVQRARPRSVHGGTRGIEGVATKMIGRDAELETLQVAFQHLCAERRLAAVTVVGDAGIGKSRLLHEFCVWSGTQAQRFVRLRGRATPQTGLQAYGLLRDMLTGFCQIQDDDSADVARRKFEGAVVPLFVHDDGADRAQAHAHLLGHLIGIEWRDSRHIQGIVDDAKQIRTRAFHTAAQWFRRVAAASGSALVLQLEDLHWADNETLDFLDHLAAANADVPLLLLAFTRPTLFERRSGWPGTAGTHARIELRPLDPRASARLAEELLHKLPHIPAGLSALLVGRAEGNPFYMEELVRMLIDQSAIRTGPTWAVDAERLLINQLPTTLTGVLQARLDGLPAPEKHALQQASVVGAVFWDQAMAAVDAQATRHLPALVRRELTLVHADALLDGLREYSFRHQLLHQVTYDTVLKRAKREGHARVAQWLAAQSERGGLRAGDVPGLAAEHFEHAGDDANAAAFHARAAEQAGHRFAHERVLGHVGRALALLGALPQTTATAELRWRLLSVREKTLGLQARRDEQGADIDALEQLAETLDDDNRRSMAARRRCMRALRLSDGAAAESAARHGMACAARAGDDSGRLQGLRLLAWARLKQGDVAGSKALLQDGVAESRRLRLRDVESNMLNVLAMTAVEQDDAVAYLEVTRQSLHIYRELGDRVNEAIALSNLGIGWLNLGDLLQARRDLDAALVLLRATDNRVIEGRTLCMLSVVALWQGEAERALSLAAAAQNIAVAAQAREDEVLAALQAAGAELLLGRHDAARQTYDRARVQALSLNHPLRHDAHAGLARVALAEGNAAAALAALQPLLHHGAAGGTFGESQQRELELTCYRTLARVGDGRALAWLTRAHTALMDRAGTLAEASLREGFLHNVPYHREIVVAWAEHQASQAPDASARSAQ